LPKGDGWVKIHRKILVTELTASQFKFFVGAILLAKSPKSKDSGFVDLSVRQLAAELRMSRSEVWRREKELEAVGMLTILDKGFVINNYNYYQIGKGVPPTGHPKDIKTLTTVPPTGRSVPPTGRSVPPTGRSVPPRIAKSAHKTIKNHKNIKEGITKKKNYCFDNILLTEEEYQKLVERFGEAGTKDRLENLSLYKKSKGKRYSSDYATILAWEKRDEKGKGAEGGAHQQRPRALKQRGSYRSPEQHIIDDSF